MQTENKFIMSGLDLIVYMLNILLRVGINIIGLLFFLVNILNVYSPLILSDKLEVFERSSLSFIMFFCLIMVVLYFIKCVMFFNKNYVEEVLILCLTLFFLPGVYANFSGWFKSSNQEAITLFLGLFLLNVFLKKIIRFWKLKLLQKNPNLFMIKEVRVEKIVCTSVFDNEIVEKLVLTEEVFEEIKNRVK